MSEKMGVLPIEKSQLTQRAAEKLNSLRSTGIFTTSGLYPAQAELSPHASYVNNYAGIFLNK